MKAHHPLIFGQPIKIPLAAIRVMFTVTWLRQPQKKRRFFMFADLDATRIGRDVQRYVEEVIQHLTAASGASVKASLEAEAESVDGFTQQAVRTVSENCRTLRVKYSGFEE